MLFDLHVHSLQSPCSRLGLPEILGLARAQGLDGVCVTDHDLRADLGGLAEGVQANGVVLLVGQEYATSQGDFLLFGRLPEFAPGLGAEEILRRTNEAGGVAVAAHPFRPGRETDLGLLRAGLCAVLEAENGRNHAPANRAAWEWGLAQGLALTGGSDAHRPAELGRAATWFSRPVHNSSDLVAALRTGLCQPRPRGCRAPAGPRPAAPGPALQPPANL